MLLSLIVVGSSAKRSWSCVPAWLRKRYGCESLPRNLCLVGHWSQRVFENGVLDYLFIISDASLDYQGRSRAAECSLVLRCDCLEEWDANAYKPKSVPNGLTVGGIGTSKSWAIFVYGDAVRSPLVNSVEILIANWVNVVTTRPDGCVRDRLSQ
ncbi:hypothetical protein EVAR_89677_1 [Eumeta japonica]|uniref:Uncharacterized protein n=1 Tax=Eumeta variegata TaxID=151549 RepID=A0A4C1Y8K1_EUMVA|nr:hypothetical protein EVAR_89677_1 [Eumeta japonica]